MRKENIKTKVMYCQNDFIHVIGRYNRYILVCKVHERSTNYMILQIQLYAGIDENISLMEYMWIHLYHARVPTACLAMTTNWIFKVNTSWSDSINYMQMYSIAMQNVYLRKFDIYNISSYNICMSWLRENPKGKLTEKYEFLANTEHMNMSRCCYKIRIQL